VTAKDYRDFTTRLARDYRITVSGLLSVIINPPSLRKLLEPGIDRTSLTQRLMTADPR